MKPLLIVSNVLLSIFIVLSGVAFVLNRTAQAQYLTDTAEKADIYRGISEVASRQLTQTSARSLGVPEAMIAQTVEGIVTKEYIQTKSEEITDQVEQILRGESTKLTVEFSDLVAQANAAGLALNPTDVKPIEIELPQNTDQATIKTAQNLDLFRFISYTLAAIFLILSLTLSILRRSALGLGTAFTVSGLTFACLALMSRLVEAVAVGAVSLPANVQELTPYANSFIKAVVSDISGTYFTFSIALIITAILCFVAHKLLAPLRTEQSRGAPVPPKTQPRI